MQRTYIKYSLCCQRKYSYLLLKTRFCMTIDRSTRTTLLISSTWIQVQTNRLPTGIPGRSMLLGERYRKLESANYKCRWEMFRQWLDCRRVRLYYKRLCQLGAFKLQPIQLTPWGSQKRGIGSFLQKKCWWSKLNPKWVKTIILRIPQLRKVEYLWNRIYRC